MRWVTVQIPAELAAQVDAAIKAQPGRWTGRAEVMRQAVHAYLRAS